MHESMHVIRFWTFGHKPSLKLDLAWLRSIQWVHRTHGQMKWVSTWFWWGLKTQNLPLNGTLGIILLSIKVWMHKECRWFFMIKQCTRPMLYTLLWLVRNVFCLGYKLGTFVWVIYLYLFCEMLSTSLLLLWLNPNMQNLVYWLSLALPRTLTTFWQQMPHRYSAKSHQRPL